MADKKEPKQLIAFRLSPLTVKAVSELLKDKLFTVGGGSVSVYVRTILEMHISADILLKLKDKFVPSMEKRLTISRHEELCQLYLDYKKAEAGEKGYEFVMGKSLTYHEGANEEEQMKILREMPLKIAYIKTLRDEKENEKS